MITALDDGLFDDLSIGLLAYPQAYTDPPYCLCDGLGVDLRDLPHAARARLGLPRLVPPDVAISNVAPPSNR